MFCRIMSDFRPIISLFTSVCSKQKMSSKELIAATSTEILATSQNVIFHKNRFATLSKRVSIVASIVASNVDSSITLLLSQAMDLLYTTLEDIKENMILFSTKSAILANRVIIY
jgi:hypothetical protein